MRKKYVLLLPAILLILLLACEVPEEFEETEEEQNSITIVTLEEGAFLSRDEAVPVSVDTDDPDRIPSYLEIELLDSQGGFLAGQVWELEESEDTDAPEFSVPDILLPDTLEEDQYFIVFRVYDPEDQLLQEKEVSFFYTQQDYSVSAIFSYPTSVTPGSQVLLIADISSLEKSDPYIRWRMDQNLLAEGYQSEGMERFIWTAPEIEGVYLVTADLFPVQPVRTLPFSAGNALSTQIVVTDDPEPEAGELQPESHFYSLYHFRGNLLDSGVRVVSGKTAAVGSPELYVDTGLFGYYLDGFSGFTIPDFILPVREGALQPFSFMFAGGLAGSQTDKHIFSTRTEDGNTLFSLELNEEGALVVIMEAGGSRAQSALEKVDFLKTGKGNIMPLNLIVSVLPEADGYCTLLWYLDEDLIQQDTLYLPLADGINAEGGSSIIGGESGFTGVIDELGIYSSRADSEYGIIQDVFEKAMIDLYGSDLRYADGFDSAALSDEYETTGEVTVDSGLLTIPPAGSVRFPEVYVRLESLVVSLEFVSAVLPEDILMTVETGDGNIPGFSFSADGTLYINGEILPPAETEESGGPAELKISHFSDTVTVELSGHSVTLYDGEVEGLPLSITLENRGTEGVITVDTVTMVSTSVDVVQQESSVSEPHSPPSQDGDTEPLDLMVLEVEIKQKQKSDVL